MGANRVLALVHIKGLGDAPLRGCTETPGQSWAAPGNAMGVVEDPLAQLVQGIWGPFVGAGGWPRLEKVARLMWRRNVARLPQL